MTSVARVLEVSREGDTRRVVEHKENRIYRLVREVIAGRLAATGQIANDRRLEQIGEIMSEDAEDIRRICPDCMLTVGKAINLMSDHAEQSGKQYMVIVAKFARQAWHQEQQRRLIEGVSITNCQHHAKGGGS